jgi:tRNA(fMet)-specific endonuclease VapC
MILLDTSVFSMLLFGSHVASERLAQHLESTGDTVAIPIVTVEEELRGWLAWTVKAKDLNRLVVAYSRLEATLSAGARYSIAGFGPDAADVYAQLRRQYRRLGSMDLRIAAIALATNSLLISRNLKDFGQIDGLRVEDWAVT